MSSPTTTGASAGRPSTPAAGETAWTTWAGPDPSASEASHAPDAALASAQAPQPTWPAAPPNPSPTWARWALAGLLAATAVLYLWGLDRSGWANSYYSAAAQAGGESWKAWFFGSLDAANSITVDKPPASLWLMGLSTRIFGLSTWSVLVPQALLGVGSVGVLYATVRRWFGASAGLIAGTVLALTPVAALMFRFNNPDAMLVFLLLCAAWAMGQAAERGALRWIMLAGAFVGFAFLAKMMQAFLVLPGFVAMYLIAAPLDLRRRFGHLFAALGTMFVAGGWWIVVVELWSASSRPFIGGSQNNSVVELLFGYNGFGRLTGNQTGSVVGGGGTGQGSQWGETGLGRLFTASYGGQIAWLLPAALVMIGILLWVSRRGSRTDLTRAATISWGGWLLVTTAVISFSQGIIHEYYTVALAPAIGAFIGIGAAALWSHRDQLWARISSAMLIAGSSLWAWALLARSPEFLPGLGALIAVGGLLAAGGILAAPMLREPMRRRLALGAGIAGLVVVLAGPTAYSLETAATPATGSLPSAGPAVSGASNRPGGGPGGNANGLGGSPNRLGGTPNGRGGTQQPGTPPGGPSGGGLQGRPGSTVPGQGLQGGPGSTVPGQGLLGGPGSAVPDQGLQGGAGTGQGRPGGTGTGQGGPQTGGGGTGSLLEGSTPSQELTDALLVDAESFTWVAATVGANSAAGFQLATEQPVLAIGGFNGTDPSPTLEEFQALVAEGEIHWFIPSGTGGGPGRQLGGSQTASEITAWVESSFRSTTIGGTTVYDLTAPSNGAGAGAVAPTQA